MIISNGSIALSILRYGISNLLGDLTRKVEEVVLPVVFPCPSTYPRYFSQKQRK